MGRFYLCNAKCAYCKGMPRYVAMFHETKAAMLDLKARDKKEFNRQFYSVFTAGKKTRFQCFCSAIIAQMFGVGRPKYDRYRKHSIHNTVDSPPVDRRTGSKRPCNGRIWKYGDALKREFNEFIDQQYLYAHPSKDELFLPETFRSRKDLYHLFRLYLENKKRDRAALEENAVEGDDVNDVIELSDDEVVYEDELTPWAQSLAGNLSGRRQSAACARRTIYWHNLPAIKDWYRFRAPASVEARRGIE
eukprot:TRINITY_DN14848_c0_g1_i1.p1 TRINITY_DN14848_c0_g1~~TRINITY_DN14848_c0_g1_i1.p1  ORF type:complete len:247 (-),score=30.51 TRINITY_DN14848_c0_g1_i1:277-1017(-)